MRTQNKLIFFILFLVDNLILYSWQYDQHQLLSGISPLFVRSFAIVPNNHFWQCSSSNSIQVGQQSKSSIISSSNSMQQYYQCDSSSKSWLFLQRTTRNNNILFVSSKNQHESTSNNAISDMKLKDMREELESYGISTRSFLEKHEFVEALEKARSEGKVPINDPKSKTTTTTSSTKETSTSNKSTTSSTSNDQGSSSSGGETKSTSTNKEEMIKNANSMKVNELRKELQEMGISSNTFFEKSEFVKAYVDAIQNGKTKKTTTSNQSNSKQAGSQQKEESFNPEYRDVIMQKMDKRDPRLLSGSVIDIRV